jgi:hypothetical protein
MRGFSLAPPFPARDVDKQRKTTKDQHHSLKTAYFSNISVTRSKRRFGDDPIRLL